MQYDAMAKFFRAIVQLRNHFDSQLNVLESILNRNGVAKHARILDAACGTGDVAIRLFDKGYREVYAIDGSQEMLNQVGKRVQSCIHTEHCLWENISEFFKRQGQFDLIYILGHSLPHAAIEDIRIILKSIFNGLNDQGIFVFDMRLWTQDRDNRLIQSNREEGIYRFLGTIGINNCTYWVEDKVSYQDSCQVVSYRVRKVRSTGVGYDLELCWDLRYSTFHHSKIQNWLSAAGFNKSKTEVQQYSEWSYLIFVCNK